MATFLKLVQDAVRESGTVSGLLPTTVVGQSDRLAKFVAWTAQAWIEIQNERNAWRWMRGEFSAETTGGEARYTANAVGISRWAAWIPRSKAMTIYKKADGNADEHDLEWMDWWDYKRTYDRGAQEPNNPIHWSISPADELCLGPVPDDVYVVRGEHRKSNQELVENEDVPELPERFHSVIPDYALLLMAEHDEANLHIAVAQRRYRKTRHELERDQLPTVRNGAEPLA